MQYEKTAKPRKRAVMFRRRKKTGTKQLKFFALQALRAGSLFLFCSVLYVLFRCLEVDFSVLADFTDQYIRQLGMKGLFAFFLLCGAATFFFVPRQLLSLVAGYFYGWQTAAVLVSLGAGLGCLLSMAYGNFLARNFFRRKMRKRIICLENIFQKSAFGIALGIRIMPVGSNTLLNMIVGAAKVPFWPFWFGSVLGYVPQNLLFAVLGSAGKTEQDMAVFGAFLMYAVLFGVGFFIVKMNLPARITLRYLYNGIVKGKD